MKRSLHLLGPGSTAVVIGAGGLGQMTIQILRALSAATTVVAVDANADKLETAKRMGADEALLSGDETIARIKDITGQQGAQLVLDLVGVDPTVRMAAQVARMLGHLTIVGLGGGALPVDFSSPPHECSVASPYWGFLTELMEVITLAQQDKIKMLVEHFPLLRAAEVYQLLHDGRIQGRAVITPHARMPSSTRTDTTTVLGRRHRVVRRKRTPVPAGRRRLLGIPHALRTPALPTEQYEAER